MSGVTSTGFERKRLDDIKTDIENAIRSTLGKQVNLLPSSVLSQFVGIFAEREDSLWGVAQDVYDSRFPNLSSDVSLDNVVSINGITRKSAQKSLQSNLHIFGTVGATIPSGTKVRVGSDQSAVFQIVSDITLVAGADEVQDITFDQVPDAGTFKLQYYDEETVAINFDALAVDVENALNALSKTFGAVSVSGDFSVGFTVTFQGDAGKQDAPLLILPSNLITSSSNPVNVTITETTQGIPQGLAQAEALDYGEIQALAFTLDTIVNPVSGIDRVINLEDAVLGRDRETDTELRARRTESLSSAGASTIPALRSALLNVSDVTNVSIFENDSDVDIDGRPPHSFEAVVAGGDEDEIANILFNKKAAGIKTFGSINKSVIDDQGFSYSINFSRPTSIPIYLSLDITKDLDFPANGAALIEQAMLDFGNSLGIAKDVVVYPKLISAMNDILGILDVVVRIDVSPVSISVGSPAVDDNISIASNEVSSWDSANITVNVI